jgi:hypothetical protein
LIALFAAMGLRAARDRDNDDAGTDYSNRFGLFAHAPRFRQRAIVAIA